MNTSIFNTIVEVCSAIDRHLRAQKDYTVLNAIIPITMHDMV